MMEKGKCWAREVEVMQQMQRCKDSTVEGSVARLEVGSDNI